ncbi:hypothetical protein HAX54_021789 [Datura stramonium]|uniref:C2H2-type domain-containing protein n=1 Tax=Datura stramonium TaxID=4076 RepID=A0ABS8UUT5_DATST|nr:hypothetical protein [Datura stramonium]
MACVDEEQKPNFKHYCRVCKKGFMCGRALGGHMRAHGIGDERANNYVNDDDDDEASDWEDKPRGSDHKRMYQLRANPNRLKSTRVCENCGKEFLSWKSFLEHGKYCCSDDQSLVSSPGSDGEEYYNIGARKGNGWSKRKRSLRTNVATTFTSTNYNNTLSSEQEDLLLAKWLIDLANARVDPLTVEPEESCASASKEEERRNPIMAYLNNITPDLVNRDNDFFILPGLDKAKRPPKGLFECKECKKVFNSHQALGGHRASHKKVKGCYAAKQDQLDHDNNDASTHDQDYFKGSKSSPYNYQFEQGSSLAGASRRKSKVHECSICHRVFSTGQALGGHKRCHWITSNSQDSSIFTPKFHFHNPLEQINERSALEKQVDPLDLNIPPDHEDMSRSIRQEPWSITNPFHEVSTDIHLHPWSINTDDHAKKETKDDVVYHNNYEHPREENEDDNFNNHNNNNNNSNDKNYNVCQDNATQITVEDDDEADSKLKLAKLSDLNDINTSSGNPSKWLQVGIGSTNEVGADS